MSPKPTADPPGSSPGAPPSITRLLLAWSDGDEQALAELTPLIYPELRKIARAYMRRETAGHTLETTGLVHEAFLRLVGVEVAWQDRHHFFALAARLMRRILVDHARHRQLDRAGREQLGLKLGSAPPGSSAVDLLALDLALTKLMAQDERKGQLIELRFFGGLTNEEAGEVLQLSLATVEREIRIAKAWLGRELGQRKTVESST